MKKGIIIKLDRPRTLRYGINALCVVEDLIDKQITKLNMEEVSLKDLRSIIYAGLFHEDNSLTVEGVGELVDEYSNITEVAEKVGEALELAFGDGAEKKTEKN